jgi:hypothetical protein
MYELLIRGARSQKLKSQKLNREFLQICIRMCATSLYVQARKITRTQAELLRLETTLSKQDGPSGCHKRNLPVGNKERVCTLQDDAHLQLCSDLSEFQTSVCIQMASHVPRSTILEFGSSAHGTTDVFGLKTSDSQLKDAT